jgi:hypothetical protein
VYQVREQALHQLLILRRRTSSLQLGNRDLHGQMFLQHQQTARPLEQGIKQPVRLEGPFV